MSWQAYIDTSLIGSGDVDQAAIFGADGTSVWATSPGFRVTPQEMAAVVAAFNDKSEPKAIFGSGFHIGGAKYITIRAEDNLLIGKKGKEGAIIVKTKQALLVAHHPETIPSTKASATVGALGDYLVSVGY